jgi:glycosyltransferase involved in cell wall biosynthesis
MRVLTLTPFYPTSSDDGAGCFVAEPIRALEDRGIECRVLAVSPFYRDHANSDGTQIRYLAIPGGLGLPSAGRFLTSALTPKVRELHKRQPIDLIHAHAALPCGQAAAAVSRELGIPFVVTVHGLDAFFTEQVHGLAGRLCKRAAKAVYRSAARVICISQKVADRIVKGVPSLAKTAVVYNGVDPQMFRPGPDDRPPQRLLTVGNFIPVKGHELLLRAFAKIGQRYPQLTCDMVGDGPEHSRLARLAHELKISDRVRFSGRQSRRQVAEAMQRCSLFVLPSRFEGLGCVYLEAMATQKPAIACEGQGIDEIIRHGLNGWLVRPGDPDDLAAAISGLLDNENLRQRLGAAARETVVRGFTLDHQAARLEQVYRECVA